MKTIETSIPIVQVVLPIEEYNRLVDLASDDFSEKKFRAYMAAMVSKLKTTTASPSMLSDFLDLQIEAILKDDFTHNFKRIENARTTPQI